MDQHDQNLPLACTRTRALLARYGDGELEEALAAPLRGHLLECPACRGQLALDRNLSRWIVAPSAPVVPAGFAQRVAARAFAGRATAERVSVAKGPTSAAGNDLGAGVRPGPAALTGRQRADEPALRLVLWLTAVAAAALLILAVALGRADRPGGGELVAEPLPDVLQQLDQLNRELEAGASAAAQ